MTGRPRYQRSPWRTPAATPTASPRCAGSNCSRPAGRDGGRTAPGTGPGRRGLRRRCPRRRPRNRAAPAARAIIRTGWSAAMAPGPDQSTGSSTSTQRSEPSPDDRSRIARSAVACPDGCGQLRQATHESDSWPAGPRRCHRGRPGGPVQVARPVAAGRAAAAGGPGGARFRETPSCSRAAGVIRACRGRDRRCHRGRLPPPPRPAVGDRRPGSGGRRDGRRRSAGP